VFGTVWKGHGRAQGHGQAVLLCWNELVKFEGGTVVLFSTGWPCRFAARRRCKSRLVELWAGSCVWVNGMCLGLEAMA